jgi:hypothetical protein
MAPDRRPWFVTVDRQGNLIPQEESFCCDEVEVVPVAEVARLREALRWAHPDPERCPTRANRGACLACDALASDEESRSCVCVPLHEQNERLREAARWLIDAYMGGAPLEDAINHLEAAAGLRQQEGS